jgi:hypothetical protein
VRTGVCADGPLTGRVPTQEPNLTKGRLAVLIDSLAAGADVYAGADAGEMEVVLGGRAPS